MTMIEEEQPDQEIFVPYIPEEIIVEILSRLPVKYILRSRCVCRSWLALISNLQFVKKHIAQALQNERSQKLLFSTYDLVFIESERNQEVDHDDDGNIGVVPLDLTMDVALQVRRKRILGSCNGLVCIAADYYDIFLFNPSTRESKKIPFPHEASCHALSAPPELFVYGNEVYGFGNDSCSDEYKLVVISRATVVYVYSSRNNYWQFIGPFPYKYVFAEPGALLNGALHWVVCDHESQNHACFITGFDLSTEQFWNMPAPDIFNSGSLCSVGVLRERLCLFYWNHEVHNEFWLMNIYGDSKSWTRYRIGFSYMCLQPLCSMKKTEEILMEADGKLIVYNMVDQTYRNMRVDGMTGQFNVKAKPYLETLASPNRY